MNTFLKFLFFSVLFFISFTMVAQNGSIIGNIVDKNTKEPLIGAAAVITNTTTGAMTDYDGNFQISGLAPGTYSVTVSYLAYRTETFTDVVVEAHKNKELVVEMSEDNIMLATATVSAQRRTNTELATIADVRTNNIVVSAVSAQQISRTQDRDASEVIKRVPGISIIDNKFVIVRGLSQRYNNVWINNSGVPSSEADTRSFSFDIIPSSQIDNITIVKSPGPEYPADFSGGFISIKTKDIPSESSLSVNLATGINDQTFGNDFKLEQRGATDFLGFDNGHRALSGNVPERLNNNNSQQVTDATLNGFNNDWGIKIKTPVPDIRFGVVGNRIWETEHNRRIGLMAAVNYSQSYKSYLNMENSRFSIWNKDTDEASYVNKYTDNQYNIDNKVGGMLNLSFAPSNKARFEFRNIFNQIGRTRYTERDGFQNISGMYIQRKKEYIYHSRMSYSGQLSGKIFTGNNGNLDWILAYSYANKNQPDRRIINQEEYVGQAGDPDNGRLQVEPNDVLRDFSTLDENIYSAGLNYSTEFKLTPLDVTLKTGLYGEFRNRKYDTRTFYYRWNQHNMPADFVFLDPFDGVLNPENFGADKVFIFEETDNRNNYKGKNQLLAAYIGGNFVIKKWNIYAGVRYENNAMALTSYTSISSDRTNTIDYKQSDFFPSVNVTYKLTGKHQLRLAYGASVNRQEFREVSPSVYYDFDLFSDVKGNTALKPAYIQNFDFRYEIYPSDGEMLSLALFYKNFRNPIEWTYLDAGGSYTYTFENAKSANNLGVELEIRKGLAFMSMPDFLFTFNGALIYSNVKFPQESLEDDRPMQGQSPYLINSGLYYKSDKLQLQAGVLYNRIGKRIVGIGRVDASEEHSVSNSIPNTYEMPRNTIDVTFSKKIGRVVEIRASVRDVLAEQVRFIQKPKYENSNGNVVEREQVTKKYKPGRTYTLGVNISF